MHAHLGQLALGAVRVDGPAEAWGLLLKATALIALSAFGSYTGSALTEAARRVVQYR